MADTVNTGMHHNWIESDQIRMPDNTIRLESVAVCSCGYRGLRQDGYQNAFVDLKNHLNTALHAHPHGPGLNPHQLRAYLRSGNLYPTCIWCGKDQASHASH